MDLAVFFIAFTLVNGVIFFFRKQIACWWAPEILDRRKNPRNLADRVFGPAGTLYSEDDVKRKIIATLYWTGLTNFLGLFVLLIGFFFFRE